MWNELHPSNMSGVTIKWGCRTPASFFSARVKSHSRERRQQSPIARVQDLIRGDFAWISQAGSQNFTLDNASIDGSIELH
jgi:hypothetical protein